MDPIQDGVGHGAANAAETRRSEPERWRLSSAVPSGVVASQSVPLEFVALPPATRVRSLRVHGCPHADGFLTPDPPGSWAPLVAVLTLGPEAATLSAPHRPTHGEYSVPGFIIVLWRLPQGAGPLLHEPLSR